VLSPCITAKRGITTNGYSRIRIDGKQIQSHRWAWELLNGAIPDPFEGNIMVRKNGKRECAECNRVRAKANYAKKVSA